MAVTLHSLPVLSRPEIRLSAGGRPPHLARARLRPTARYLPPPEIDPFALDDETPDPNPYVDYGRYLTPEGGILFCYKDIDERLRHVLWRYVAWATATGLEGYFLLHASPAHEFFTTVAAIALLAWINWQIVAKPVEISRSLELHPDCMIVDGTDIFWRGMMEIDMPRFAENPEGHQVLSGVYGTRFVEYLTVRKFDELDRTPEVFAANLEAAMRQVWGDAPFSG